MTSAAPLSSWTRQDWQRIIGLCALSFSIMLTYAIARPACESLFLQEYKSRSLPQVWLAVTATTLFVVSLYNRYAARVPLLRLMSWVALGSALLSSGLVFMYGLGLRPAVFALYLWKDIYIVVLVEIFWSFANTIFAFKEARRIYGLFGVMGSLAGVVGGLVLVPYTRDIGTVAAVYLLAPLFGVIGLVAWGCGGRMTRSEGRRDDASSDVKEGIADKEGVVGGRGVGDDEEVQETPQATQTQAEPKEEPAQSSTEEPETKGVHLGWGEGFRLIARSRYLLLLFFLVLLIQIFTNSVDYQFNQFLEQTYGSTDGRTVIYGRVYGLIDGLAMGLYLLSGPLLRFLGVATTLMSIPMLLLLIFGGFLLSPVFWMIAAVKVTDKSISYSLFRVAKEMLYLPLTYNEKTQGKSVIDIVAYRGGKGVASLLLMGLLAWGAQRWLGILNLTLLGCWLALVTAIALRYRALEKETNPVDTTESSH